MVSAKRRLQNQPRKAKAAMNPDQGQQMTVFGAAQLSCP
jgi:hypothetical protein